MIRILPKFSIWKWLSMNSKLVALNSAIEWKFHVKVTDGVIRCIAEWKTFSLHLEGFQFLCNYCYAMLCVRINSCYSESRWSIAFEMFLFARMPSVGILEKLLLRLSKLESAKTFWWVSLHFGSFRSFFRRCGVKFQFQKPIQKCRN